jgi:hypothetical protein
MCERGCVDPRFLDLGTSLKWVVSFTPLPLYPRDESPRHPLDRMLGGPHSRYGRYGWVNILDPSVVEPVASRSTDWATVTLYPNWYIHLQFPEAPHFITQADFISILCCPYVHKYFIILCFEKYKKFINLICENIKWTMCLWIESKWFLQWCVTFKITGFQDFIHCPVS